MNATLLIAITAYVVAFARLIKEASDQDGRSRARRHHPSGTR